MRSAWLLPALVLVAGCATFELAGSSPGTPSPPPPSPSPTPPWTPLPPPDTGTGADGPVKITGATTINVCRPLTQGSGSLVTLSDPSPFRPNDRVLLWQVTDGLTSGPIGDPGRAGIWEIATVSLVGGASLILAGPLSTLYASVGSTTRAQVCTVPQYGDVKLDSEVYSSAWDGQSGGVVAFFASGTVLATNANLQIVNADGAGFGGGAPSGLGPSCNVTASVTSSSGGGGKGGNLAGGSGWGSGALRNGGGGGDGCGSGGGGGGNAGAGGQGGPQESANTTGAGQGGEQVQSTYPRLLMGGGGGGGQWFNGNGPGSIQGGNGGGVVFVRARRWRGTGYVSANGGLGGSDGFHLGCSGGSPCNGSGGGGAGGTMVLIVDTAAAFSGTLQVSGGSG